MSEPVDSPQAQGPHALRVLLVDDHNLFRTGLRSLLEDEGFTVRDASCGETAVSLCRGYRPDVVLMDMNMPGMSGIDATRRLLDVHPGARVLMLTVATDDEGVLDAIRAGASGYLLKQAKLAEIAAAIQAVAEGRSTIAPEVAGALIDSLRRTPEGGGDDAVIAELTPRERVVLSLLARGHDNAAIASELFVSPSTVKHHVSNVLDKLGVANRVQAAAIAIRHGLDREEPA